MKRSEIKSLLGMQPGGQEVLVKGWVRTFRNDRFIALNDGSTIHNLQIVVDPEHLSEDLLRQITTSACLAINGQLVPSQGSGQAVEVLASKVELLGDSDPAVYPIQPKKHTLEFLREKAHLRLRTNTFSAVFRIRHAVSYAIHKYFHENGFYNLHTPIITGSDAEGAGEMFRVSTLSPTQPPMINEEVDWREDFFGKQTNLTVSGQLEAEVGATALGKVYTFGPTFRAENSNTKRHLAEFWMIEPEMAFYDLQDMMDLSEDFLKEIIRFVMREYPDDLAFLDKRIADEEKQLPANQRRPMGLIETLEFVLANDFARITYTEAIYILRNSKPYKKRKFEFPVEWGRDLQAEHERYLVEKEFKRPVIVSGYPQTIKAFYMREQDEIEAHAQGPTVAAMDILFPGIGEVIGGSQREERLDKLKARMAAMNIPEEELWWYLELRKFGTNPHSGFGLGLERLVQFVTGIDNIRDVTLFPRTPKNADF